MRAVSFHPTGELLLTGGFDKTLRLFQVRWVRLNLQSIRCLCKPVMFVAHMSLIAYILGDLT